MIKPDQINIKWSDPAPPGQIVIDGFSQTCHYDHCIGTFAWGEILITWKECKQYPKYEIEKISGIPDSHPGIWTTHDSLNEAKLAVETIIMGRVLALIS